MTAPVPIEKLAAIAVQGIKCWPNEEEGVEQRAKAVAAVREIARRAHAIANWEAVAEANRSRAVALEAALRIARPYVEQEWGTGDWQQKLETDQELIDRLLDD